MKLGIGVKLQPRKVSRFCRGCELKLCESKGRIHITNGRMGREARGYNDLLDLEEPIRLGDIGRDGKVHTTVFLIRLVSAFWLTIALSLQGDASTFATPKLVIRAQS